MASYGFEIEDLASLKLPSGWTVVKNYFSIKEPIVQDGEITNGLYFGEDLLALNFQRPTMDYTTGEYCQSDYYLWLGWFPEFSPEGRYVLTAVCGDEHIGRYESKDGSATALVLQSWIQVMYNSEIRLSSLQVAQNLVG